MASYHWRKLGVTWEYYDKQFEKQGGRCAICRRTEDEAHSTMTREYKYFIVDHDHETGALRGLLCNACNTRMGWLEKNVETAVDYLRRWRSS